MARKKLGKPLGCPKGPGKSKLDSYRPEIEAFLKNGSTKRFIARRYGTSEIKSSNGSINMELFEIRRGKKCWR